MNLDHFLFPHRTLDDVREPIGFLPTNEVIAAFRFLSNAGMRLISTWRFAHKLRLRYPLRMWIAKIWRHPQSNR